MMVLDAFPGLGTHWWVEVFDLPTDQKDELAALLQKRITTFNDSYSRFSSDSFTTKLNVSGTISHTDVDDRFITLLKLGKQLFIETDGVFNFLTGTTQVHNGYGATGTVSADTTKADPVNDLEINDISITLHAGAVDFGGFGKGWLIDAIAYELETQLGHPYFMINGGGDMYGTTLPDGKPIDILVEHPTVPKSFIAKVPLRNQGFAASSTYKRTWKKDDTEHNHIIAQHDADIAAHIIANSALEADVYGTLACALTPTVTPKILAEQQLDYLLMQGDTAVLSKNFESWLLQAD